MKKILLSFAALIILSLPSATFADTFVFNAPATAPGSGYQGGANQFDLDHHRAYTWQIGNVDSTGKTVNLTGMKITSASLTFKNISNWDTNPNKLFVHLLDQAKTFSTSSGSRSKTVNGATYFDDAAGSPVTDINDDFSNDLVNGVNDNDYNNNPLVDSSTSHRKLFERSFAYSYLPTSYVPDYTYTFTADDLTTLSAYFLNGNNFAFGFDPDCHFWNNGITFNMTTQPTPTPEPTTMALLGTGIAGLYYRRRRQKQNGALNS